MNFGAARLGFWFRNVDRGSKSKKVLVFYDPWTYVPLPPNPDPGVIYNYYDYDVDPGRDVYPIIRDREIASGFEPELVVGYSNLPADMSKYAHIWDIGYASPYEGNQGSPSFDPTNKIASYIQGGGAMFMLGENRSLNQTYDEYPNYTRDHTILSFLNTLGASGVVISPEDYPGTASSIIQPQFLIVNNNDVLPFNRPGAFTNLGPGTAMTTPVVVDRAGSAYPAVMWTTGTLPNARLGAIISVLDINFLAGVDLQVDFIDNLIASLNQR